jgi:hypothetical protein
MARLRERKCQGSQLQQLEDEYVARELAVTRAQFDPGPEADRESKQAFEERLNRSERYARWSSASISSAPSPTSDTSSARMWSSL